MGPMRGVLVAVLVAGLLVALFELASASRMSERRQMRLRSRTVNRDSALQTGDDFIGPGLSVPLAVAKSLKDRFKVGKLVLGTIQEQAKQISYFGKGCCTAAQVEQQLVKAQWKAWAPGASSPFWKRLLTAYEKFEATWGTVPVVQRIVLYEKGYNVSPGPILEREQIVASYAQGELTVYALAELNDPIVAKWSKYPQGRSGRTPAKLIQHTPEAATHFIFIHELTHAFLEKKDASDNSFGWQTYEKFRDGVGWNGNGVTLYDAGVKGIALPASDAAAKAAPTQYKEIYQPLWNDGRYIEQPFTQYALSGGCAEDFPESVAAFVLHPKELKLRSPRRFGIIEAAVKTSKKSNGKK
jgi:hypothetical protein